MMVNALLVSKIFVTYIHAQENIKSSIFSCCALPSLYVTLHFYNSILLRLFEYRALLISETIQNYYFYFIYNPVIIFTVDLWTHNDSRNKFGVKGEAVICRKRN